MRSHKASGIRQPSSTTLVSIRVLLAFHWFPPVLLGARQGSGIGSKLEDPDGKKNAYGFRNRENLKTAIFFHCGGLALYPVLRGKKR
jgi:hypothetical protein